MKTTRVKTEDINHRWYLIDAKDKTLGRMSTRIAKILMGKNKVTYSPDQDNGDAVIVINAKFVRFTGNKVMQKMYYRHSGYVGNLKELTLKEMMEKDPTKVITLAVKRMLPKNRLASRMMTRLMVYNEAEHPHKAQKPEQINF